MTKNTRANDGSSNNEVGELREMMQKMLSEIETLVGEVLNFKRLDQVVLELKDQLVNIRGNHRDKSPANSGGNQGKKSPVIHFKRREMPDAQKLFDEKFHGEKSANSFTNHHSQFSRWSKNGILEVLW